MRLRGPGPHAIDLPGLDLRLLRLELEVTWRRRAKRADRQEVSRPARRSGRRKRDDVPACGNCVRAAGADVHSDAGAKCLADARGLEAEVRQRHSGRPRVGSEPCPGWTWVHRPFGSRAAPCITFLQRGHLGGCGGAPRKVAAGRFIETRPKMETCRRSLMTPHKVPTCRHARIRITPTPASGQSPLASSSGARARRTTRDNRAPSPTRPSSTSWHQR